MIGLSLNCASGGRAFAGPWSTQPVVGVAAEYASNPALFSVHGQSEAHAALFLDLPVNFDLDTVHYAVTPRVRYSDTTGYSSVTSNYLHLDASAKFANEIDAATLTGALYQDSSLLYAGEVANGIGVRRDTASVDANWQHALSERAQFQVDANAVRTRYAQSVQLGNLVDYSDVGVTPAASYAVSELSTVRILGGVSRYKSLNGSTDSGSTNLQLGWDHHFDELWTVSTTAGYSKSTNHYHLVLATIGNYLVIETIGSSQNGAVYSANLTRQSETLTATASATRALTPTGFAFLTRQDTVSGQANYNRSERLSFSASVTWANIAEPLVTGGYSTRRFYDGDISANWRWTEQWFVSLHVNKIGQRFGAQTGQGSVSPTSNGVSFEISRHFYQTNQ
jgi:hypothetical protein